MESLYRKVLIKISSNKKFFTDIDKKKAINQLNKLFKPKSQKELDIILLAYNDWREIYTSNKCKSIKNAIISFRCSEEEKEIIKEKLGDRRIEDVLLGVLINE